ncbi:SubName: Full=Uncharacterized protein {ECO:0000313/EMBL:CCA72091.1} [Serendipita indica DSM 11827]|uniref:Uncharacterized protein n=1 Tax=Serendipita indica (strain DSM 11827) TaxID=1109443 RepID=G4TL96_SERID|nr:SubName: Full=Uncharacterized protein {ECO:0000313/EMBL:CCA72091.1} [Serendipita indica DSM 11827]CCA72091.1 hypothetical protein PIIN_06027 [Serendipita indica DSM 11827]
MSSGYLQRFARYLECLAADYEAAVVLWCHLIEEETHPRYESIGLRAYHQAAVSPPPTWMPPEGPFLQTRTVELTESFKQRSRAVWAEFPDPKPRTITKAEPWLRVLGEAGIERDGELALLYIVRVTEFFENDNPRGAIPRLPPIIQSAIAKRP